MSLILDALKRAERERHADARPALGDVPPSPARPRRRRFGRWVAVATLVIVTGALAWTLLYPRKPPLVFQPRAAAPAPKAPAEKKPRPPLPTPPPREAPPMPAAPGAQTQTPSTDTPLLLARPAPAVIPGTEGVASLDDLAQPEDDLAPPPAVEAEPAQPEPKAEPVEQPAMTAEPQAKPAPASTEAPRPVPPALTQPAQYRKLREMPPEYRADFPALNVEVHVYERAVAQRFVIVNGTRYREGERLAAGPTLVQIVPEGLVLDYRGEKVLYTLGR